MNERIKYTPLIKRLKIGLVYWELYEQYPTHKWFVDFGLTLTIEGANRSIARAKKRDELSQSESSLRTQWRKE